MNEDKNLPVVRVLERIELYLQLPPKLKPQAKGLHRLRQASRELLSLLPVEDYPQQRIKRVIQASNKIRDLDVLLLEVLPSFPQELESAIEPVKEQLVEVRWEWDDTFKNDLQLEMLPEIESCIEEYAETLQSVHPTASEQQHQQLKEIEKQFKKVKKRLSLLELENKQIHKLRLKIKRMRYQVAHFFPEQDELFEALKYLQKQLGEFHDYDQAQKMIAKYTDMQADDLEPITKHLSARQNKILSKVRKKLVSK